MGLSGLGLFLATGLRCGRAGILGCMLEVVADRLLGSRQQQVSRIPGRTFKKQLNIMVMFPDCSSVECYRNKMLGS